MYTVHTEITVTEKVLAVIASRGDRRVTVKKYTYDPSRIAQVHGDAVQKIVDDMKLLPSERNFIGVHVSFGKMVWVSDDAVVKMKFAASVS